MAVYELIAAKVSELGKADVDELAPYFPEMNRKQIEKALTNAKFHGLLVYLGTCAHRSGRMGRPPGVYGPSSKSADPDGWPKPVADDTDPQWSRPVASVWELGARA